jgi:tetratricopeptide (TPR) repeat protein
MIKKISLAVGMKNISNLLLVLFLFTPFTFSQHAVDRQIQLGLNKIYNFNWSDGLKVFNKLIKDDPKDPRGYYYKSTVYLWYYLGNFNEAYLDTFSQLANKSIDLANQKLKTKPTPEINYIIGSVYYNKLIAEARSGNYLQAIWMSNQMKKYLDAAVKENPDLYDAYLGLGLYNFALSQIPSTLRWATNLIGMSADKEAGLDYVKKAVERGTFSKVDAEFYLSQIYSRVIVDYPAAKDLLSKLFKRYPKNLLFEFSLAWVNYELNDLNSAEKQLRNVISSKDTLYSFVVSNAEFMLGNVYFAKDNCDSATTYYQRFLDDALNNDYKGIANLNIGLCYEIDGSRKEALKYYEKASTGNSDIDEDLYAQRKKDVLLENKLSENQIKLIKYFNLIKQNRLKAAKDSLLNIIEQPKVGNQSLSQAYLYLSQISLYQKRYKESLDFAVNCIKTEIESDKWIHAYAYYYAAWDSYYLKNYLYAKLFLLQIDDLEDYDFSNSLQDKIYTLQRLLPAEKTK